MSQAKKVGDDAYDDLLDALVFGDLEPGLVVDERVLVERFGHSLAAVRDALHRLALEGMVERRPRVGTRIPELGLRELHEVFEMRVVLEGECAHLAGERATQADTEAMRKALVGFEGVIARRDFRRLVRMDRAFHRAIASASQNRFIARQLELAHNVASRFWYFGLRRIDPAIIRADIAAHLDIVAAIERRKPAAAAQAMRAVLGHFPDTVRLFLTGGIPADKEGVTHDRSKAGGRKRERSQADSREASQVP